MMSCGANVLRKIAGLYDVDARENIVPEHVQVHVREGGAAHQPKNGGLAASSSIDKLAPPPLSRRREGASWL